jgi:heme exporter protein B
VRAIVWKDLLTEIRTRDTLASLFILGVLVLVVFQFALNLSPMEARKLAPGLLWTAILLSSAIAIGRTLVVEREAGCIGALMIAPIDRGTVFLAKLTVNVILLAVFEVLLLPVFAIMTDAPVWTVLPRLAVVLFAGSLGIAAVGTLFALAAAGTRARELMLPLVALPLEVPLVIAAVQATDAVLEREPPVPRRLGKSALLFRRVVRRRGLVGVRAHRGRMSRSR